MPFNGSGTFNRLYSWVVDAANSVNISSTRTDAEMNGFAAGLTNCITRDGQSPPSADTPWGGKKITNLANATVSTDALNIATGDTRYILAAGATNLTLTGTLTAATLSLSGNAAVGGTLGVTGNANFSGTLAAAGDISANGGALLITTNNKGLFFKDANAGLIEIICDAANNFSLFGTDATGAPRQIWSVPMHSGTSAFAFNVSTTGLTPTVADNSTKFATTAFVATAITNAVAAYAPIASPTFTGVPAAPTAAAGTATTQLATTAFADGLRDIPQNLYTTSQALTLAHRGQSADFNGTSLTCTIPANASVAFPVGAVIIVSNLNASALSIAITTDTLTMSGSTTTGTRTLGQNGEARLRKVSATSWLISGTALT